MNHLKFFSVLLATIPGLVSAWGNSQPLVTASPARWVPEQAVVCLEILQPETVVEPLMRSDVLERFSALPVVAQGQQTEGFQAAMGLVRYVELTSRTNWQAVVRKLTRDGLAVAVGSGERHLLVLDGVDAGLLGDLHEMARQIAAGEAQKQGHPERVDTREVGDVRGWTFNGKEAHAVLGDQLLAASDAEVLKAALNLREGEGGSLADRPDYQEARRAVGERAVALVFVDLSKLREAPKFTEALKGEGENPLATLLLANLPDVLLKAPWLAIGAYTDGSGLSLRLFAGRTDALEPPPAFIPMVEGDTGAQTLPVVPRQIASLRLNRDLETFYAAKDELFPQRTSGLIFFENMMGIFFSGRNLTDEILAALCSDVRLVVAGQAYDPAIGTPEPQLPAFALVFRMRDPATFNEVLEEAWQKALGLVNFTRGQKALPGLILDRVSHDGTAITVAAYSAKGVEDRAQLDQRFNFRPTLAMVHGAAILSSSDQLACDLMDALGGGSGPEARGAGKAHTVLRLGGQALAAVLRANRAGLVRNNMIKEGKSEAEAELGIDTLCAVVGWVQGLTVTVGSGEEGRVADIQLTFTQP